MIDAIRNLLDAKPWWLAGLQHFAGFVGAATPEEAAAGLLTGGSESAERLAIAYRGHLTERMAAGELVAGTVNHRLTSLKALVATARSDGVIAWAINPPRVPEPQRTVTAGPSREWIRKALKHLGRKPSPMNVRDAVLLRLIADLAFERTSIEALDLADVNLQARTIAMRTPAGQEKMPRALRTSLARWIHTRQAVLQRAGHETTALFIALDRVHVGSRLTDGSIGRAIRRVFQRIGAPPVSPRGLRNTAIREQFEKTGDIIAAAEFAGHKRLDTTARHVGLAAEPSDQR